MTHRNTRPIAGRRNNLPPIIDAPDMHAEEFYDLHSLSPRTPPRLVSQQSNISIAMLCITTAIAAAAVGWFLAMLHYT